MRRPPRQPVHFWPFRPSHLKVIIDKAKECFSALTSERGMITVDFDQVEIRCGVGPDIKRGRIVVRHVN